MKRSLFLLAGLLIAFSPALTASGAESNDAASQERQRVEQERRDNQTRDKNREEIERKLGDKSIICARAEIEGNYSDKTQAEDDAKTKALAELSRKLQEKIGDSVGVFTRKDRGFVENQLSEISGFYLGALLKLSKTTYYQNFPDKNKLTALCYVTIKDYNKEVDADLKDKKEIVITPLRDGLAEIKREDFEAALASFTACRKSLQDYFGGYLYAVISTKGQEEDIAELLVKNINDAEEKIRLKVEFKEREERLAARKDIEAKMADENLICESAFSEYKDYKQVKYDATAAAKQNARVELSNRIQIRVVNTVSDILKKDKKVVEEQFSSVTKTYSDALFQNSESKVYQNYPGRGQVTVLAWITVKQYKDKVEEDLKNKKIMILFPLKQAFEALNQKNFGEALHRFLDSRDKLLRLFGGVLNADANGDGQVVDVGDIINSNIRGIVNRLEVKALDDKISFDNDGRVSKRPSISVVYRVDENTQKPVVGLPVKAEFVKGAGKIVQTGLQSGPQGDLEIPVESVDVRPDTTEAAISAEIDGDKLGLEKTFLMPNARIEITKRKSIAYCVNFFNSDSLSHPDSWAAELRELIGNCGFSADACVIEEKELTPESLKRLSGRNNDYLVYLVFVSESRKDPFDMYKASIRAKADIYLLPSGRICRTIEGAGGEGYSTSAASAGYKALGKINASLSDKIKSGVKALK